MRPFDTRALLLVPALLQLLHVGSALASPAEAVQPADSAKWYVLEYNPPRGEVFTSFSGTMKIPPLPRAGTYYLWVGLQPTDMSGVYQNVLDGRKGTWWLGTGWCCAHPSLPWGGGFKTEPGETVTFENRRVNRRVGDDEYRWESTTVRTKTGDRAHDSFALGTKHFNQALFAIELYGESWDFGPLVFTDVKITSTGTDGSWCKSYPHNKKNAAVYSVRGNTTAIEGDGVTCSLDRVTLVKAASSA